MEIQAISPRLLAELIRADEEVVLTYELGLVGFYAVLSKLFRRRKGISLVEADYKHLGRLGTARLKVAFRRFTARFVDVFVANSQPARHYLLDVLKVPDDKILVGWWLAGLPPDLRSRPPRGATTVPEGVPLFLCAGQLIPRKGIDLLIEAVAAYRQEFGPCVLWVIGGGPEKVALVELARRLQVEDCVVFLGMVDHEGFKGALEACDIFVLPSLRDFVGRVAVEALTVGVPVVLSPMTGAAGTIVQDDVNGVIVDPRDRRALAEAMRRAADSKTLQSLREGVSRMNGPLLPDAAAEVILEAVALAHGDLRASSSRT
jgi:glycosyltransferase involved in cell wall biosynthesis